MICRTSRSGQPVFKRKMMKGLLGMENLGRVIRHQRVHSGGPSTHRMGGYTLTFDRHLSRQQQMFYDERGVDL